MAASHDSHVTITPFWKGVIACGVGYFAWRHRGWIIGAFQKARGAIMHGALGMSQLADGNTGIEMPSSDPAIAFRQMRRYAFAASQDRSPIVGLTHASYALIALDILEEAVGRDKLAAAGCDAVKIRKFVTQLQDMHSMKLQACDTFLSQMLAMEKGEGGSPPGIVFADSVYSAPTGA